LTRNNRAAQFVRIKRRGFLMKGDPLPPLPWGWAAGGLILFSVFLLSLKLR
jgi:hypothetical protein